MVNVMDDLFLNNKKFQKLFKCFLELAETEIQKDAIEQIMKNGEYNGFKLNSMLSNEKHNEKSEIKRRIAFVEIVLHDEELFLYLVNNELNVFHGTKMDALETILSKGLFSSYELSKSGIQLKTGEERIVHETFGKSGEKRNFISLTDDFDTSALYAGFPYEEQSEYYKRYYGKDLKSDVDIPIIICFKGRDIKQKYAESLIWVKSTCNEIAIDSSISPSDIKCIITSYDKIDYVKSIVSKYGIDVLGYDHNDRFEERLISNWEGKFYSSNLEIDEHAFEKVKQTFKKRKTVNSQNSDNEEHIDNQSITNTNHGQIVEDFVNQTNIRDNSAINETKKNEHLSEDLSMKIASDIKMDIVFYLTEQYNNGVPFVPITANDLITKYNMNESVAQKLALEINKILENYIQDKIYQKENYRPFTLDEVEETESIGGKSR